MSSYSHPGRATRLFVGYVEIPSFTTPNAFVADLLDEASQADVRGATRPICLAVRAALTEGRNRSQLTDQLTAAFSVLC